MDSCFYSLCLQMASRKRTKTTGASSSSQPSHADEDFDRHRFIQANCQQRYDSSLHKRELVIEKGIQLSSGTFRAHVEEIERRGWHNLLNEPPLGCLNLVREFYANLIVVRGANQPEGHVWLRGQWVDMRPSSINAFLHTPDIQQDDFSTLRGQHVDWDEILQIIALPNAEWTYYKTPSIGPKNLVNKYLNPAARVWAQIMFSRLMPSRHTHSITRERCLLLYCLITQREVNLGQLIKDQMMTIPSSNYSLPYPSLITALALQAGVLVDPAERMTDRGPKISDESLSVTLNRATRRTRRTRHAERQEDTPSPSPPPPQARGTDASQPPWLQLQAQIDELRLDMRSTRTTLQNRASRQYSSIYRGIQGLEALMRQQLSPQLLQQIPPLPPADPELERLTDEEAYAQEEPEDEAEAEDSEED